MKMDKLPFQITHLLKTTLLVVFYSLFIMNESFAQNRKNIAIVIHGGAGTIRKANMTPEKEQAYKAQLKKALEKGYSILEKSGTSLDAVEETLKTLEDSPLFNAGKGSVLNSEGTAELDASIMDGKTLKAGAVAGVTTVKNPISAARKVMEHSPHVMLTGDGAEEFAKKEGCEMVDNSYFIIEDRKKLLERVQSEEKKEGLIKEGSELKKFGTVGAVALDQFGNIAAATSTGGMTNKKFGRIGDSPIIGAGTYANNGTCGVSATGHGEYFIRLVVAYDISALMEYKNLTLKQAAEEVIMNKLKQLGGEGGVVALDKKGNIVMVFNTLGMYRGSIDANGKMTLGIYRENE